MIVGTAGHIDHGKTTLVRALTGVDTDRLPEEQRRGISIELGYAYLRTAGGHSIGFVDVPGHERLVHTMLAGATGIDHALLLVAADDGVMPQTREHLAVLALLGLQRATVVITKTDRVEAERLAAVEQQVQALLQPTPLAAAPMLAVSAVSGEGLDALRAHLEQQAAAIPPRDEREHGFRLAIDRAFVLPGIGTVVTGTAHGGRVQVGDELLLLPAAAGQPPQAVRVRSLHAQNAVATVGEAGQRLALALPGVAKETVQRGQWLVAPEVALQTQRLDATLLLWHEESRPLRSGTTVHVHLGASDTLASVAVLDRAGSTPSGTDDAIAPGHAGRVQLVLRAPIGAWRGDRLVLRDASGTRTIAGGVVLDPLAPTRYRRTPARLVALDAWQASTAAARLAALLDATPTGIDLHAWTRAEARASTAGVPTLPPGTLRIGESQAIDAALSAGHATALEATVIAALDAFHARQPDALGPDSARLRRLAAPRLGEPLWRALLARLIAQGKVAQRGAMVHRPEHGVRLSATEERLLQKVLPRLLDGGFDPPWLRELAADARESEALLRLALARVAQRGELHAVVKDLYYPDATMTRMAAIARHIAADSGEVSAAAFRDATGLGRKRAIQVLEYFDRVGLLRRVKDTHRLRADTRLFSEQADQPDRAAAR